MTLSRDKRHENEAVSPIIDDLKITLQHSAHACPIYARMIPIYLAEMESPNESDPDIVEEFQQGNWVVNKNGDTSFCALGADHSLEHTNRSMKVSRGLIGITLNTSSRNKFFLIAPELARLAEEARNMAGLSRQKKTKENHKSKHSCIGTQRKKAAGDLCEWKDQVKQSERLVQNKKEKTPYM